VPGNQARSDISLGRGVVRLRRISSHLPAARPSRSGSRTSR
jgi:hypothetical protein